MSYNLLSQSVIAASVTAQAAGTTAVAGTAIDLQATPADNVRFVVQLGTLTATQVTSLSIQSSPDNSTWTTIATTANCADADSNKLLIAEWVRPNTRYVRPYINRGTANAVIAGGIAILSNTRKEAVTQDTTVSQYVSFGPSY